MFNKQFSEKSKIISLKDVISISIVFTIIGLTVCTVWGSAITDIVKPQGKSVSTRNLAMFASIAYADLEKISNYNVKMDSNLDDMPQINILQRIKTNDLTFKEVPMVTDEQLSNIESSAVLLGIPLTDEVEDTYSYLFYGLASTNEVSDWKLVNYAKFNTTVFKGHAQFTAMTFKRGNDIVIAYRGTDFDDIGDWLQDIFYGAVGYAGQESVAQDYAKIVAEHYAQNNDNINIYITGHSLGGYLAQIGGAALADKTSGYSDNLKEVSYFNGMGLQFWSNIANSMSTKIRNKYNISSSELKELKNVNSALNKLQMTSRDNLKEWKKNGGKLVAYRINGDLISALGIHPGDIIGFDAHNICINHHSGNNSSNYATKNVLYKFSQTIGTSLFNLVNNTLKTFNNDLTEYIEKYGAINPLKYIWITHETDGFFAVLPLDNGLPIPEIKATFSNIPSKIKVGKTHNLTLTIETVGGKLEREKLTSKDFVITNTARLKIPSSISPTKVTQTDIGYKYTYTIKLRATYIIGEAALRLKPNVLKLKINNELKDTKFKDASNNLLIIDNIQIKLK